MVQGACEQMQQVQQLLIDDFAVFDDWESKYGYLIELGQSVKFDSALEQDLYLVEGCQSRVWLVTTFSNGVLSFEVGSDAILVRGLLAIVKKIYDKQPPEAILQFPLTCFEHLGLSAHLSPARNNGVHALHQALKARASEHLV